MFRPRISSDLKDWLTISKAAEIADLAFKVAAIITALAAANFLFRPSVKLDTHTAVFLDLNTLRESYKQSGPVPNVVQDVVNKYNKLNEDDLQTGQNKTRDMLPVQQLCASMRSTVIAVFDGSSCDPGAPNPGKGHYYERYLLQHNHEKGNPLTPAQLRDTLTKLHRSEFRTARCFLTNTGFVRAVNVTIRIPEKYFVKDQDHNDPFPLKPREKGFFRDFETERGMADPHTESQFEVDWDVAEGGVAGSHPSLLLIAIVLFVPLLLVPAGVVIRNDYREFKQERSKKASVNQNTIPPEQAELSNGHVEPGRPTA
jgi:hypothetical protein